MCAQAQSLACHLLLRHALIHQLARVAGGALCLGNARPVDGMCVCVHAVVLVGKGILPLAAVSPQHCPGSRSVRPLPLTPIGWKPLQGMQAGLGMTHCIACGSYGIHFVHPFLEQAERFFNIPEL